MKSDHLRKILLPHLAVLCVLFVCSITLLSQKAAFEINIGPSVTGEIIGPGRVYDALLFDAGYSMPVLAIGKSATISLMPGAQYGHSTLIENGKRQFDLAAQLTAQFVWNWKSGGLELGVGSGPGYQSTDSPTQVKGFVFSNHGTAGLRFRLFRENLFVAPQYRFRHLSNASTKQPNHGIDNHFLMLGLRMTL